MDKPDLPIYPMSDHMQKNSSTDVKTNQNYEKSEQIYPDFMPWKDHTQLSTDQQEKQHQRLNNASYLNKGYFEAPQVANEYYSARNLILATVFLSNDNCNTVVKELSTYLTNAYKTRNEVINKIKYDSNHFKIPNRVTLTSNKKEAWLRELSNYNVPLKKIGEKIPHGLRNKVLIDAICTRGVPINRSVWLTKCVLYGELVSLRRKHQNRMSVSGTIPLVNDFNTFEKFEVHWLQEWTQQVADYVLKFSREMLSINSTEKKAQYLRKFNHLINYVKSLYVESLLDKSFFLSLVLRFLKDGLPLQPKHIDQLLSISTDDNNRSMSSGNDSGDGDDDNDDDYDDNELAGKQNSWIHDVDMNYGQRLAALTLIKVFWNDLIKVDYLSKELSELLLLNYFFIERWSTSPTTSATYEKFGLSDGLRFKILKLITDTVKYLFEFNCNIFIIPNYWMLIESSLVKILLNSFKEGGSEKEHEQILKQLELIKYRNESLILNMKNEANVNSENNRLINRSASFSGFNSTAVSPAPSSNVETDYTFINRNSDDILNIIEKLDTLRFNEEFSNLLKPGRKGNKNWQLNLKVVLCWCVSPSRDYRDSIGDILFICNFLRNNVLADLNKSLKAEFDNEILEIIYQIAEDTTLNFVNANLYVLINELYQLKLITIAAYLRKLIASGIFYLEPGTHQDLNNLPLVARTHLEILENLPVLNNRQCDSILKKWTPSGFDFKGKFTDGQAMLQKSIIDKVFSNSLNRHENTECTNYISSLNVGLQFLLINWLTNEIKSKSSSAVRLIHFTPAVVTSLYQFYSQTAGLTVFFKVLIPTILKNDGGMIIFYLDTLFLISKLTVRHFKLIKFIPGGYDSPCIGYDIFKLIVQAYKDLCGREYDYFRFDNLWNFMDAVIEKAPENSHTNEGFSNSEQSLPKLPNSLTGKDTLESPMHINTVEIPAARLHAETRSGSRRYTSTDFRNDISYLRGLVLQPLTPEDSDEIRAMFETDIIGTELQYWYDNFENLSEEKEIALVKLLRSILVSDQSFTTKIREFLVESVKNSTDSQRLTTFLMKMNVYDITRMNELVKTLLPVCSESGQESIVDELVLGTEGIENRVLSISQKVLLELNRHFYRVRSIKSYSMIILRGLLKGGPAFSNAFFVKYRIPILRFLNLAIVTNTKSILNELYIKLPREDCLELLNIQLGRTEDNFIKTLGDFEKFIPEIDEFNLPVCQILLGVISNSLVPLDFSMVKEQLEHFMNVLLSTMNLRFSNSNSFFGELFSFMAWTHKICILEILETKFLTETKFDNGIGLFVTPTSQQNLLPSLNDFLKKFAASSSSSANSVESDKNLLQKLLEFIDKLVAVVNSEEVVEPTDSISCAISVFLRILIIHKLSLCEYISIWTTDQLVISFVSKLIDLLNSKYLSNSDDKLRILLYDLLLLMKSGITQEMHSTRDTELSDSTSPQHHVNEPLKQQQAKDIEHEATSPKSKDSKLENVHIVSLIQSLFDLPEPSTANPFAAYLNDSLVKCSLMLDNDELERGGDISVFNNRGLVLKSTRNESSDLTSFGENNIMKSKNQQVKDFKFKSFEILEDIGTNSLNDGCINLQLFDAYTTRENPP